jgi:hypothetical protein
MANKPEKFRDGALAVTVWKNDGEKGPFYTATPSRSYKQGEEWKETNSYGPDEILRLAKLLDQAHTWIVQQQAARHKQADSHAEAVEDSREQGARRQMG